jgi:ADP-ribose pyrophosphatase YjhB (NUDIX family)
MAHQKQPKKTETAFALCLVQDNELFDGLGVILVHNISDADIRARKAGDPLASSREEQHDKPAGWGLPGGGVKTGDLETPAESSVTELGEETGLSKKQGTSPRELSELHIVGYIDKKTNAIVKRSQFFPKGQRPSIHLSFKEERTTYETEHVVYIFRVEPDWDGSALQALLRRVKAAEIGRYCTPEKEILRDGVWTHFSQLPSEVDALGIEGLDEIDGVGLFPISLFGNGRGAEDFPVNIYKSHFKYIRDGLRELGLLPPEAEPVVEAMQEMTV